MCQLKGKKNLHFRSSPCVGVVWVEVADDIMYVLFCAGACFLLVGLAAGTLGGGGRVARKENEGRRGTRTGVDGWHDEATCGWWVAGAHEVDAGGRRRQRDGTRTRTRACATPSPSTCSGNNPLST